MILAPLDPLPAAADLLYRGGWPDCLRFIADFIVLAASDKSAILFASAGSLLLRLCRSGLPLMKANAR